jgi:plastocyanin
MRKAGKRTALVSALACAGTLALAASAQAITIVTPPNAETFNYQPSSYTIDQGGSIGFSNTDPGVKHDVTARGRIGGGPLFRTPTVTGDVSGTNLLVGGTEYLTTGSYEFFCSVHPLSMQATLNVTGSGTPVARPDIEVKIITGKIARIARRGRVLVKVTAVTKSDNVALVLKLGKRRIGSKTNIDLEASQVRRVPIVLSNSNRNRFLNRARANLKLVGTVQFGAPDGAQKIVK